MFGTLYGELHLSGSCHFEKLPLLRQIRLHSDTHLLSGNPSFCEGTNKTKSMRFLLLSLHRKFQDFFKLSVCAEGQMKWCIDLKNLFLRAAFAHSELYAFVAFMCGTSSRPQHFSCCEVTHAPVESRLLTSQEHDETAAKEKTLLDQFHFTTRGEKSRNHSQYLSQYVSNYCMMITSHNIGTKYTFNMQHIS